MVVLTQIIVQGKGTSHIISTLIDNMHLMDLVENLLRNRTYGIHTRPVSKWKNTFFSLLLFFCFFNTYLEERSKKTLSKDDDMYFYIYIMLRNITKMNFAQLYVC